MASKTTNKQGEKAPASRANKYLESFALFLYFWCLTIPGIILLFFFGSLFKALRKGDKQAAKLHLSFLFLKVVILLILLAFLFAK